MNKDEMIKNIEKAVLNRNYSFFDKKISNYNEIKINHLSILGFALYNGNLEICEKIILANKDDINIHKIEEDGFKTVAYLAECEIPIYAKKQLVDLFVKELGEDFDFSKSSYSLVSFCISMKQPQLLIYIYKNYLKNQITDLQDREYDLFEVIDEQGDYNLMDELTHLLNNA